jgi:hypothetical protein
MGEWGSGPSHAAAAPLVERACKIDLAELNRRRIVHPTWGTKFNCSHCGDEPTTIRVNPMWRARHAFE